MPHRSPLAALAIVVSAGLALTACTAGGDTDEEASSEPIRYAVETPDRLIPGNQYGSYAIVEALFAPLVQLDGDGELSYLAAESVESDDAVTWTITLRDGWTFHNGDPVTAQDYVDTWNYAAYAPNGWVNAAQLAGVVGYDELSPLEGEPTATELSGLEVIDDLTFTVELSSADRQFPLQLTIGQATHPPIIKSFAAFKPCPTTF